MSTLGTSVVALCPVQTGCNTINNHVKVFEECLPQMDIHHCCSLVMVQTNCFKTLTYSHERMQANVKCLMWVILRLCLFLFVEGRSQGANFLSLSQLSFSCLSNLAVIFSCLLPFIINLFQISTLCFNYLQQLLAWIMTRHYLHLCTWQISCKN